MANNDPILGQVVWDKVNNLKEFFTQTKLYEAVELHFSKLGHTHTKSQITDFSHTHDDRYYAKSEINSSLATKQDTIPNYSLVHSQSNNSGKIVAKVYSDGLDVYVTINSTASFTISANDLTNIMTLTCDSKYLPHDDMSIAMIRSSIFSPRVRLGKGGTISFYNSSTTTSFNDCNCAVMYPLKSRLP